MLPVPLAASLRAAGLRWSPARGDRFVLPDRGMDEEVFVLSDMTVEVHDFPTGREIGFNGVTEWALDSVEQDQALWLPYEGQLRDLLGGLFRRLERLDGSWVVTYTLLGEQRRTEGAHPEEAYALALLDVLLEVGAGDQLAPVSAE
ncbi:MAG TPA: pilus assembly protein CpaE [Actinomycetes bacterium]|nr:pilus assembly protein CpaE [Actinomycetes bacterium]